MNHLWSQVGNKDTRFSFGYLFCAIETTNIFFLTSVCVKRQNEPFFLVPICQQGQNESFLVSVPVLVPVLVLIPAPVCQQGRSGSFLVSVS